MSKMPFGSEGVNKEQYALFKKWVDELIGEVDIPIIEPTPPPATGSKKWNKTQAYILGDFAKSLLNGSALTPDEYARLTTGDTLDTKEYELLLQDWLDTPAFQEKLMHMMRIMLHQNVEKTSVSRYSSQVGGLAPSKNNLLNARLASQNLNEMFARTAMRIINNDGDFRDVVTTRDWEVTTVTLAALARADHSELRTFDSRHRLVFMPGVLDSDYTDWRTVRMLQSDTSTDYELSSSFVAGLRAIGNGGSFSTLAPRVGFFNSPAFLENWETNDSNDFRITVNQAMIVGLSKTFEAGDTTPINHTQGLDAAHSAPDTECYACHKRIDPMRNVFKKYYDARYSRSENTIGKQVPDFSFKGVSTKVSDMDDFARAIANHPNFAYAWASKVCQYFSSNECDKKRPKQVQALADQFANSSFNFKTLIIELFKSPLILDLIKENNDLGLTIARQDHYCFRIDNRINDIRKKNGLDPDEVTFCDKRTPTRGKQVNMIPSETIVRGQIPLLQATQLDPFYLQSVEFLCRDRARFQIKDNANATFNRAQVKLSLDDMVQHVMGIPSNHDDYAHLRQTVQNFYDLGRASPACASAAEININHGGKPACGLDLNLQQAMENVWRLVCASPSATGMGIGY